MNIEDKLKEELHLHTLAMKEQEKLEARLLGKSDYFNRIVEMNTEAERRRFAAMAMQGIIANGELVDPDEVTDMAIIYADELIEKLNKKKDDGISNN